MGRSPCCPKEGLNRGAWTAHEDKVLKDYIRLHGEGRWRNLPKRAGLKRCGKSCRLRWLNYLRPDIKRGNISSDEEELIVRLHKLLGNRWSLIAGRLPGRTDNEIKNYWNTNLSKKVKEHSNQSISSSRRHFASPPKNVNTTPQNQQPPPKLPTSPNTNTTDSHIVRTKATKCTKLLLITPPPLPNSSPTQPHKNINPNASTEEKEVVNADACSSQVAGTGITSYSPLTNDYEKDSNIFDNHVILSLLGDEEDTNFSTEDLLMDYDACLSELLSSDFGYGDSNGNIDEELLLAGSDQQPLVFSDEILKDWTQTNFSAEEGPDNLSNKICSFTPVLETIDE